MPRLALVLAAVSLSALIPCPAVLAQQAAVTAGQRVRVEWSDAQRRHRAVGTVLDVRGDSLDLTDAAGVRTLAVAGLERIDLRMPRSRSRGAARGAGVGAVVGLALGFAAGAAVIPSNCREGEDCTFGYAILASLGTSYGAMIGAIAGAFSPGRRWQRVR
jgi:hypothetical protein